MRATSNGVAPEKPVREISVELAPLWLGLAIPALLLAFVLIVVLVKGGDTQSFDERLLLLFRKTGDLATPVGPTWLPEAARDITALGSEPVLLLISALALGYVWLSRNKGTALFVSACLLVGQCLSFGLKLVFERPRPEVVPHAARVFTASFPSSHAMLSAVTYLTLGCMLTRFVPRRSERVYISSMAALLCFLIGVSRLYLGVQWPTDVLGGWMLGSAWALLCWALSFQLPFRH